MDACVRANDADILSLSVLRSLLDSPSQALRSAPSALVAVAASACSLLLGLFVCFCAAAMYQAPRPISSAPTVTAFTPSATPLHVAAVPVSLPSSSHHRPIAMARGGVAGSLASARAGGPATAAQFVQRIQPPAGFGAVPAGLATDTAAAAAPSWSPAASPSATSVAQIHASVFGPLSTPSPDPTAGAAAAADATATPIAVTVTPVAPAVSFAFQPAYTPRVDLYTPQSPMMSPLMSPQSEYSSNGVMVRRDSVDETASANAHLHNILWRNAQSQLRSATTLRHGSQAHINAIGTPGSAGTRALLSPKNSDQTGVATPPAAASPSLAPVSSNGTRAIPIARPRVAPNSLSSLHPPEDGGSREGSRRGSTSAQPSSLLSTSATHGAGSFLGSSSPIGSSLSTSYTILSHTPPTRAVNPQQHDQCFSPATQAGYFRDLQAAQAIPSLLPMLHSLPGSPNLSAQHSPALRASALAQSLAQRQPQATQQQQPASGLARSVFARGAVHVHAGSPATANPSLPVPAESHSPKLDDDPEAIHPKSCPC